ncbi:Aste57867_10107 [Aphanomyces stellatus]|uniref:Aste57867_10107 protein n=1 Tax=Aphanomyces stellatus TaxID=120398 RepID=A0A485KQ02_9STRA|nr:hypothetical protein As57867_010068 [Aphanomyces stellatus]VFT86983.1 Aste57867_10107 [Aphanomyces stellatus]
MLPQVLLTLSGTSSVRTATGQRVALYHVSMTHRRVKRQTKIRYRTLRKFLRRIASVALAIPPKHPFRPSVDKAICETRLHMFRACLREISSVHLTDGHVHILHAMFDEADRMLPSFRDDPSADASSIDRSGRSTGNVSQDATASDQPPTSSVGFDDNQTTHNPTTPVPWQNEELTTNTTRRTSRPHENAFAALKRATASSAASDTNDKAKVDDDEDDLSTYLVNLSNEMLVDLHLTTPSTRVKPSQPSTGTKRWHADPALAYTDDDAAYFDQLARDMWSSWDGGDDARCVDGLEASGDEASDDEAHVDVTQLRVRELERALEAVALSAHRERDEPEVDEVIRDVATTYFPNLYTAEATNEDDDNDSMSMMAAATLPKQKAARERQSMSHVLQGYIDDYYYKDDLDGAAAEDFPAVTSLVDDVVGSPTDGAALRRPRVSISLTA